MKDRTLNPFDRLYSHAMLSQDLLSLKREVHSKVEDMQI